VIGDYDGLAIRSATKVTRRSSPPPTNLKVIGRAGIGVDNVDIPAASKKGIIVMNTPFGNSITTAEHAIAMMFAVARQIPEANASTHAGKWEKSRFMGVELTGKTLGVIGAGNIGSIVCDRALGLKMKVSPMTRSSARSAPRRWASTKVELDELLARADFITLHVPADREDREHPVGGEPRQDQERACASSTARAAVWSMRRRWPSAEIRPCRRRGLRRVQQEPATENPLFNLPNVSCTPHLGASTTEAQENVALQVAEQMSDYLLTGAVSNALNMPSSPPKRPPVMGPVAQACRASGRLRGPADRRADRGDRDRL
jgi:D-3-phosphoglycerate dehydrogenase